MNLTEYYRRHPRLLNEESAYLEKEFLESVFYPEFGDAGLACLDYQKKIYDSKRRRNYYIDFVVRTDEKRYAIELDGYNYHGKLSAKEFEKQEERTNEITRQGYELIRFSFYKIKNKPAEVRKELRQRIDLPQTENQESPESGLVYGANWGSKKKGSSFGIIVAVFVVIILALFFVLPILFSAPTNTQSPNNPGTATTKTDASVLQRSHIESFVNQYNSSSNRKISNLSDIDVNDESSPYYRKTNTYGKTYNNEKLVAMHGDIDGSNIWIISCSSTNKTNMRVYVESNDHELMTEMVHIGIPYFNPNSTDNAERLAKFDNMMNQPNSTGMYINAINGTYTALRTNDVTKWRLNMNTGCANIMY